MQRCDKNKEESFFTAHRPHLGGNQQELLSELVSNGDWCQVGERICGSTYGGRSKHERIIRSLERRKLVEVRESSGTETSARFEARALPHARDALD